MFSNTGHGINATPPAISSAGSGLDNGVSGSTWDNVIVFGVDGDHYGFVVANGIYNVMRSCLSFGGGAFHLIQNSSVGHYGNLEMTNCIGMTFISGSAHCVFLDSASGLFNLMHFNRLQAMVIGITVPAYGSITSPSTTQERIHSVGQIGGVRFTALDAETNMGSTITLPNSSGAVAPWTIDRSSYIMDPNPYAGQVDERWRTTTWLSQDGTWSSFVGTGDWPRLTDINNLVIQAKPGEWLRVDVSGILKITDSDGSTTGWSDFDLGFVDESGDVIWGFGGAWAGNTALSGLSVPNNTTPAGTEVPICGSFVCKLPTDPWPIPSGSAKIALFAKAPSGAARDFRNSSTYPFLMSATILPR